MTTEPSRGEPTTPTGEPSQAAMEAAKACLPPCVKCGGNGGSCKYCLGTGRRHGDLVKSIALALDLHAAAAVQEERERCARIADATKDRWVRESDAAFREGREVREMRCDAKAATAKGIADEIRAGTEPPPMSTAAAIADALRSGTFTGKSEP